MNIPGTLKYTTSDEWVKVEGNTATIGITDYAQDQLSDIVYVEINFDEGDDVKKGAVCVVLESVKAAADVSCPVAGKVSAINEKLADSPELVNNDPYGDAWMIKLEMSNPSEADGLMSSEDYKKYLEEREH